MGKSRITIGDILDLNGSINYDLDGFSGNIDITNGIISENQKPFDVSIVLPSSEELRNKSGDVEFSVNISGNVLPSDLSVSADLSNVDDVNTLASQLKSLVELELSQALPANNSNDIPAITVSIEEISGTNALVLSSDGELDAVVHLETTERISVDVNTLNTVSIEMPTVVEAGETLELTLTGLPGAGEVNLSQTLDAGETLLDAAQSLVADADRSPDLWWRRSDQTAIQVVAPEDTVVTVGCWGSVTVCTTDETLHFGRASPQDLSQQIRSALSCVQTEVGQTGDPRWSAIPSQPSR